MTRLAALLSGLAIVAVACTPAASPGASSAPSGGASAAPSGGGASPSADNRQVELTFSLWAYEGSIKEEYDKFIAEFLEMEPRVTAINVEFHPFVRYHDVVNVMLASGTPPDVAHIAFNLAPVYIDAGTLLDLRPALAENRDYNYEDLRPSSLLPWTSGGGVYGIPFTNSTNVMYYNKDLFEAAGIKDPDQMVADGEWTWENVRTAAKQLKDVGGAQYGFIFGNALFSNGWRILEDIWAPYGAAPWSADGTTCGFNSPQAVESTQLVWDMIYTDKSHPEPGVDAAFFDGAIGMGLYRPSQASRLEGVSYEWGIAPQPSGPEGYVPAAATNGIAVFKDSPNADLATAFLGYTTNEEQGRRMGRNFPSPRQSLQTVEELAPVNPIISAEDIETTVLAAITAENASWGYSHKQWGPLQANAQRIFDGQIWKPDADVKAGLDQVCADIAGLLG
jgi:multiple sugar transport system substrate-binding protein